jgi:hypothetical protein
VPVADRVFAFLERRVPSGPVAAARVALGVAGGAACFEACRLLVRILAPPVVPLPFVSFVPRLTPEAVPLLALVWGLAAIAFIAGFKTQLAGTVLVAASAYALVLDQRTYSNHLYLLVLLTGLLTAAHPGTALSMDARRAGGRPTVAAWPIFLLKVQVSLVYGFSALAKLTPDFLSGAVLSDVIRTGILPQAWRSPALMAALAAITILVELFIAIGLWMERSRWSAAIAGAALHTSILLAVNSGRFSLAIFAFQLIATYPLFLHPTPQMAARQP